MVRVRAAVAGGKAPNSFLPDGSDVSSFSAQLCRAHANCYENFPLIGGLLLLALATGNTSITDPLAPLMLAARITQSLAHLYSTSVPAMRLCFAFFLVQFGIACYWTVLFLGKYLPS